MSLARRRLGFDGGIPTRAAVMMMMMMTMGKKCLSTYCKEMLVCYLVLQERGTTVLPCGGGQEALVM